MPCAWPRRRNETPRLAYLAKKNRPQPKNRGLIVGRAEQPHPQARLAQIVAGIPRKQNCGGRAERSDSPAAVFRADAVPKAYLAESRNKNGKGCISAPDFFRVSLLAEKANLGPRHGSGVRLFAF